MNRTLRSLLAAGALALGLTAPLAAADTPENAEARLRETLRATILQLRTVQGDLANAQAAQTVLADEKKALGAQNEALKKQAVADHLETDKTIADLKAANTTQTGEIAQLKAALAKTRAAFDQAAALARAKEEERARTDSQFIVAQRRGDDLHAKNVALYKLSNDLLVRYEKFGLGDALAAREPFVGLTRVKLENFVQDYADKLAEQRDAAP